MKIAPNSTIAELRAALQAGLTTSVGLVELYLNRIASMDRSGPVFNSVPVLNPEVFAEARRADLARAEGRELGSLHGIPFVVKDSFSVKGLTVASGSPAFAQLEAQQDAASVRLLRKAGAVLLGKTTMPPMAAGGMQKGVYGRAVSPYNPAYMPAAWVSGSSNGSGVAVSASFASFGLAEETLSSGRSPASNGALVAYTPSRGMISIQGNWPLLALRDVVVPYARTVEDLFEILDVIVQPVSDAAGDLWLSQTEVDLPAVDEVRPASFASLTDGASLQGKRIGVPRLFIGKDTSVDAPVQLRESIRRLWDRTEEELRALGAELVEVDPPVFYEFDRLKPGARDIVERGYWSPELAEAEFSELAGAGWEDFLRINGDPRFRSLSEADFDLIFPEEFYGLGPELNPMPRIGIAEIRGQVERGLPASLDVESLAGGFAGLERFRKELLEDWMDCEGIDLLAFPAASDVAPADSDTSIASILQAWKPGAGFSQGGWCFRPLGIPAVIVPMGIMADTEMPVGVTFAGRAYSDNELLRAAYVYERATRYRTEPAHAAISAAETRIANAEAAARTRAAGSSEVALRIENLAFDGERLRFEVRSDADVRSLRVTVDGAPVEDATPGARITIERRTHGPRSTVSGVQAGVVIAVAELDDGTVIGHFEEFDRPSEDPFATTGSA